MMGRCRVLLAVGAAAACAAFAGTASADTSQAGCQAYGAFVANTAHALGGPENPGGGGAFVSGIATSGAGALAGTVTVLKQQTC
jgi:hypothetical protein